MIVEKSHYPGASHRRIARGKAAARYTQVHNQKRVLLWRNDKIQRQVNHCNKLIITAFRGTWRALYLPFNLMYDTKKHRNSLQSSFLKLSMACN